MLNNKKISIVFPCKNEGKIISGILSKIPKFIDQKIVVDNRSIDNTFEVAKKKGATVYKENRNIKGIGYGYAIQTGIKKAKGKYIIIMDGDKTYPMSYIKKIINLMEKNQIDFVSCKRFPLAHWRDMSPIRFLGGLILTFCANFLFKTKITDILSGMWIFRKDIVSSLDLRPGDWNMSLSVKLSAALSYNINFFEYHIPYRDRRIGASKQSLLKTGFSHFSYLIRLKYDYLLRSSYQMKKVFGI